MDSSLTKILIYGLILNLLSCASPELSREKEVIYEIIPELTDSLFLDKRLTVPWPPPPPGLETGDSLNYLKNMRQSWENYEKQKERISRDTTKVKIGIKLGVQRIEDLHIQRFVDELNVIADAESVKTNEEFQLEIKNIRKQEKFEFSESSDYLTQEGDFKPDREELFVGMLAVSNIIFDTSGTKGVLTAGFNCGRLCGQGYRIYIELVDGEWGIKEMELYSVA